MTQTRHCRTHHTKRPSESVEHGWAGITPQTGSALAQSNRTSYNDKCELNEFKILTLTRLVVTLAPTTIYEDNQGAIKLTDNPVNHPKTKHIAVHYHAIQEHIANSEI